MLKVTVKFASDEFSVEGDVTFAELKPMLELWLGLEVQVDQAQVDALTERLRVSNDRLTATIDAHTPQTS